MRNHLQDGGKPGFDPKSPVLRVCLLGLGGGGFHWEVERIIRSIKRPLELILIFAGPNGGIIFWKTEHYIKNSYVVRSPTLTGDNWLTSVSGVFVNVYQALRILSREKVDLVLAVGTSQAVPFGIAARILRKPLWFVESFTRVRIPCRTGVLVSQLRLATRNYYYWPELARHYTKGICIEEAGS